MFIFDRDFNSNKNLKPDSFLGVFILICIIGLIILYINKIYF